MIREELLKTWTNLKPKFNQLVQWKQAFPNETAHQVKVRINTLQSSYNTANEQLNLVRNQNTSLQANYNQISSQLTTTRTELEKERSWWDKWNNNGRGLLGFSLMETESYMNNYVIWDVHEIRKVNDYCEGFNGFGFFSNGESGKEFKRLFKEKVYQYYRDR